LGAFPLSELHAPPTRAATRRTAATAKRFGTASIVAECGREPGVVGSASGEQGRWPHGSGRY
jgi:hypothetical protein